MLILNPGRVAAELRAGTLSEAAKARLLFAGYLLSLLFGGGSLAGYRTSIDLLMTFVYFSVAIGGFWGCFRVNQAGDDRAFVERYMCLSVPLIIWLWSAHTVAYYVAFWILRDRPGYGPSDFPVTVRPYVIVSSLAVLGIFFTLLRRYLRQISEPVLSGERRLE